jgi:phage-related minor tail protein
MAVPIVVSLLGLAVQWGTLGADVRHLERRADTKDAELARVSSAQASAATQSARIEARLDGMERELSRLARAVERLTDAPATSARSVP